MGLKVPVRHAVHSGEAKRIVERFFDQCQYAYDIWCMHRELFDDNKDADELRASDLGNVLGTLSAVTHEYSLVIITRLHDPAHTRVGRANVSVAYLLDAIDWPLGAREELTALAGHMRSFVNKIRVARNTVIAHLDGAAVLNDVEGIGAFEVGEDHEYFTTLERFAGLAHEQVIGWTRGFDQFCQGDAAVLVKYLCVGVRVRKDGELFSRYREKYGWNRRRAS